MTEDDIKKSIEKHTKKPLIVGILFIVFSEILNSYVFESNFISITVIMIAGFGACIYIFEKVLTDLFAEKNGHDT